MEAQKIAKACSKLDVKVFLYIVEQSKIHDKIKELSYPKFLDFLNDTNGILEIVQHNQTGLTLRTMESLFYNKKLVTTNKSLKDYSFYHSNNIFILGENPLNDLPRFLNEKYHVLEKEQIEFFKPYNWIQRFDF
jgi:hypothetical protein